MLRYYLYLHLPFLSAIIRSRNLESFSGAKLKESGAVGIMNQKLFLAFIHTCVYIGPRLVVEWGVRGFWDAGKNANAGVDVVRNYVTIWLRKQEICEMY